MRNGMKGWGCRLGLALGAVILAAGSASAQVPIDSLGATYTQNFDDPDGLEKTGTGGFGTRLPVGWTFTETGGSAPTTYRIGAGTIGTGDTYSFGASGSDDRAFGGVASGTVSKITILGRFSNDTGSPITSVDLAYVVELWRLGTSTDDAFPIEYATGTSSPGPFSQISDINVTRESIPCFGTSSCGAVDTAKDGNDSNFRVSRTKNLVVTISSGSSLWLRWTDANGNSNDHGFALDDFTLKANGAAPPANVTPFSLTSAIQYVQDFDTLPLSGTYYSDLPEGWTYSESNEVPPDWTFSTSSGATLDNGYGTFSVGASSSPERAFGQVASQLYTSELHNPKRIGAVFVNNTGEAITSLKITYTGEQWRVGSPATTADQIDFQYSTDATSLLTGAWTDVNDLDFSSPVVDDPPVDPPFDTPRGLNGNDAANRATRTSIITGLNIAVGATFWIRWEDSFRNQNGDDLLAIDDFGLTPNPPPLLVIATTSTPAAGALQGATVDYDISVQHHADSGADAPNVVISNTLPAGVSLAANPTINVDFPLSLVDELTLDALDVDADGAGIAANGDIFVNYSAKEGALQYGDDIYLYVEVTVDARQTAATLTNTARVDYGTGLTASDTATTGVIACRDFNDCGDSAPCTTDTCETGSCVYTPSAANPCSDDDNTTADACNGVTGECDSTDIVCDPAPTQCQDAVYNGVICTLTNKTLGTSCSDGLNTTVDQCDGQGVCVSTAIVCDPAPTQCQTAVYNGSICTLTDNAPGTFCTDGLNTTADACDGAGVCVSTAIVCDPAPTQCQTAVYNGSICTLTDNAPATFCTDGLMTTADACDGAGVCVSTAIVCDPAPTQCQTAVYDGSTCTLTDNGVDTFCDDGLLTTADKCDGAGVCVSTEIVCDPAPTQCQDAVYDGSTCTLQNKTQGSFCDDGLLTTVDVCNGTTGACDSTQIVCNPAPTQCQDAVYDGFVCTLTNKAVNTACDDGLLTTIDKCNGVGACVSTPIVCSPTQCEASSVPNGVACTVTNKPSGDSCNDGLTTTSADKCNGNGGCAGTPIVCNPLPNQCQDASFNGATCTLVSKATGTACNDNSLTTATDVCNAGVCAGAPIVCPALTQCQASATPNGTDCTIVNKTSNETCDDGLTTTAADRCNGSGACAGTTIVCVAPTQCETAGVPNGTTCPKGFKANTEACDDGLTTTAADLCDGAGACAGTTIDCAAPTQCQTAGIPDGTSCVPGNKPDTATCDDGLDTTSGDHCDGAGACTGTLIACAEDTACGSYVANGVDCELVAKDGPCDDAIDTTHTDICVGGECVGTSYECLPSQCEATSVANGTDCTATFKAAGELCDDGLNSTRSDVCDGAGACGGETYECTVGSCDASSVPDGTDCVTTPAVPGTECDDLDPCTSDDVCDGARACMGTVVECGDGEVCDLTGACASTHCTACEDSASCGEGSACVAIDAASLCLLVCETDEGCGVDQVCRELGEGMYCFDASGDCAAPVVVIPDEDPEVVEPQPEVVEPQPEVVEPEVEVGPETTEPVAETSPEVTVETTPNVVEEDAVIASGGSSCAGGDASSGLALLMLAGLAFVVRRRTRLMSDV